MGLADRLLRLIAAITVVLLIFMGYITGISAIILGALVLIFAATSLFGFCPLYSPFRINTIKKA